MILEFKTIRFDSQEQYERELKAELQGEASVEFFRESDYVGITTVEMDDVVDYDVSPVYLNQEKYECVFARLSNDDYTRNLMISGEEFRILLQHVRNIKIKKAEDILIKAKNENYSEGI